MDRIVESSLHNPQRSSIPRTMEHRRMKKAALWPIFIVVAIFCVWRMAVFVPQPLDSNSTLRPALYAFFSKFLQHYDSPEQAFFAWNTFCNIALLIPPALAVLNYLRRREYSFPRHIPALIFSQTLLLTSIGVCLLLCKFPTLLEPELNPDEGQFLSSAHKLFYDANFFRAVDCGTSGPVNIYPLMLPSILGISPDFASSRVIALITLFLCIWLLYLTIRLIAPDEIARVAIVPAAGIFAVFKNVGLVEYSSEDIPILLAGIALYAAVRVLRSPADYRFPVFLIGFVSSAVFFAKLQAVPVLAALAGIALACIYATRSAGNYWRPILVFLAGVAPLPLLHTALCLATGVWRDFWMSYLVTNMYYADVESRFVANLPQFLTYLNTYDELRVFLFTGLGVAAAYVFQRMRPEPDEVSVAYIQSAAISAAAIALAILLYVSNLPAVGPYLALIAIATAPIYLLLRLRERPLGTDPVRWFGLLTFVFIVASMFAVYEAHRPFPHYLLFLFIPISSGIAWMLIRNDASSDRPRPFPVAFVALTMTLTVVCQAYIWGTQDDHVFNKPLRTLRAPEGDFIRSLTTPHGQIAVWGWTVAPYLSSGRVPATRDTNMANFFRWPLITAYYRDRFLEEMRRDPPELFIDAVGPASFALTDRAAYGFEKFPEIEFLVRTSYVHVADRYDEHYYLRRDLASQNAGSTSSPR
jgi:hypothetical protein